MNIQLKLEDTMRPEITTPVLAPLWFDKPSIYEWIEAHCLLLAQAMAIGFYSLKIWHVERLAV